MSRKFLHIQSKFYWSQNWSRKTGEHNNISLFSYSFMQNIPLVIYTRQLGRKIFIILKTTVWPDSRAAGSNSLQKFWNSKTLNASKYPRAGMFEGGGQKTKEKAEKANEEEKEAANREEE